MKKKQQQKTKQSKPRVENKAISYSPNRNSIYSNFFSKNSIIVFFALIVLILFLVFHSFLFGFKTYFFKDIASDTINLNLSGNIWFINQFYLFGIPQWTFAVGMGQSITLSGLNNIFSILMAVLGKENLYYSTFLIEAIRIILSGLFFYLFLKKIKLSNSISIVGSLLFAFSGFMILGGEWGFSTDYFYLAFLLYSFEKLYQDDNWILFTIAVVFIAAISPVEIYLLGLMLLIYVIYKIIDEEIPTKKVVILFAKIIGLGLLALIICTPFLWIQLDTMINSPRVSGSASYSGSLMSKPIFGFEDDKYGPTHAITAIMRFFSTDMVGTGLSPMPGTNNPLATGTYQGWYNYFEAPLYYCGLFTLVLLPQFLSLFNKKKRILLGSLLAIAIIPVIFPFFRYAFWLFTGNYYRSFSLLVIFIFLLVSMKSLHSFFTTKSKPNILITLGNYVFLLILLYYPYEHQEIIQTGVRTAAVFFITLYTIILLAMRQAKYVYYSKIFLFVLIIIELSYFSSLTIGDRPTITGEEAKQKVGYNDYTVDAVQYLKSFDKSFFRINKEYSSGPAIHTSMNDAMAQDYFGTISYNSFNQLNYINFLAEMQLLDPTNEYATRWAPGVSNEPLLYSFANIKYVLTKNPQTPVRQFGYEYISKFKDVMVLRNPIQLPMGYTYAKYISQKDFHSLSKYSKSAMLYKACVINDSVYTNVADLPKFNVADTSKNYTLQEYAQDVALLKQDTLSMTKWNENHFSGTINLPSTKMLFFTIPFDKGWTAKVDGKLVKPMMVDIGFTGLLLPKGNHTVELNFLPPYYNLTMLIAAIGLILFVIVMLGKYFILDKRKSVAVAEK